MQPSITNLLLGVILATLVGHGSVPLIAPSAETEEDGMSLLSKSEKKVLREGTAYNLLQADLTFASFDVRNPEQPKPLDHLLTVDQKGFVNTIKLGPRATTAVARLLRIECYYWEMRDFGYVTPIFKVKWFVQSSGENMEIEAFSFGIKYSEKVWNTDQLRPQWVKGAAAAYQAATYKAFLSLGKILNSKNSK